MPNYKLTGSYVKVKAAGKISTMRVTGGMAWLVPSSTAPADSADAFPMYERDVPFTFAANVEVWAKTSGARSGDVTLCSFEVAAAT